MKKYEYILLMMFVVGVWSDIQAFTVFNVKMSHPIEMVENVVYKPSNNVVLGSLLIGSQIQDKERAQRFFKHAHFYAKQYNRTNVDIAVDLFGYPLADYVVGEAFNASPIKIDMTEAHEKFVRNNIHLVVASALTQGMNHGYHKGFQNITKSDVKKHFVKPCVAQMTCDVADEYLVKPAIKKIVGNSNSWSAWTMYAVTDFLVSCFVIDVVNENL